jgi:sialic acid synthase SpsE
MKIGDTISLSDLVCLRPGTGLPPTALKTIIGRKLTKDLNAYTPMQAEDLE